MASEQGMGGTDQTLRGERLDAPHSSGIEPPRTTSWAGATDCHLHIFDPRYPRKVALPTHHAAWATVADYRLFQRRLGLSRAVIVSPTSYGFDNRCLVEALEAFGDRARGIAAVKLDISDAELDQLNAQGVRGIRLYAERGRTRPEDYALYGRRVARLGWHLQIAVGREENALVNLERFLEHLPCPLVFDHMGYVPQPQGIGDPGVAVLRRLLDRGNTWVKLSGVYIRSKVGHPTYADVNVLAAELARAAPQRVLWGSDWPHTVVQDPQLKPDGARLFDQLAEWVPDATLRRRVLVDNPQSLYWRT
jgi:D-galactarolactone isomerase